MKLKFKTQDFQTAAVAAVVDLFKGQERKVDTFTIVNEGLQIALDGTLGDITGVRNALNIGGERLLANMNDVQKRFMLPLTSDEALSFCIEMETGTGKTYVYTKTIFELNKQYGFTKFIVVVPSVAIREGVYKSFQITADHFSAAYDNAPVRCFIYDSKKVSQIRLFATSSDIEIMIINIDAFKKSENIFNQERDQLNGDAAKNLVQGTRPIVIIDEPQSVDNTPKSKEAIASLNPLCVFRYSATHREKINLLYRLTPVDAYQMGLVKEIVVSSNSIDGDFNRPYIRMKSVSMDNGFTAKIEIDRIGKGGNVERKILTIRQGADVFELSGERDLYEGYAVAGIDCMPGKEGLEFTNGEFLPLGKAWGDFDENIIKRAQIRRTVEKHLEKELTFTAKGIKVLSLFFIDEVAKYRTAEGEKGIYAEMFEESYIELLAQERFSPLRDKFPAAVTAVHNGYFSQDKRGIYKDTKGDTNDDYDTYNTIMKDKEWLLSFDCPLRFIFSHSALKEGWDNPNVFQVCTLIEQRSNFTCRQKVGRGLRLCVNQDGDRIEDRNINILHVIANESFGEFAANLQKEIENETGVKFGVLQMSLFQGLVFTEDVKEVKSVTTEQAEQIVELVKSTFAAPITPYATEANAENEPQAVAPVMPIIPPELPAEVVKNVVEAVKLGAKIEDITPEKVAAITYMETVTVEKTVTHEEASEIMTHLENKGYVTKSGVIKDTMKEALKNGTLDLPVRYESARAKFESVVSKAANPLPVRNANTEVKFLLKKQIEFSPEFTAIWDRIKGRTSYRVTLDEEALISRAVETLNKMERVHRARVTTKTARVNVETSGVSTFGEYERYQDANTDAHKLPNLARALDDACFLSRRTAIEILRRSGRTIDFLNNPQKVTEMFVEIMQTVQGGMEIDGIRYKRLDGQDYYFQEVFDAEELTAFLDKNAVAVQNSVYDYVRYDSETIERPFAVALDGDPDVKLFFKIPPNFKIETPIGTYNPDWAVFMEKNGEEKFYFVIETKGVSGQLGLEDLQRTQAQKIKCGARHFAALDSGVEFPETPVKAWSEVKAGL